MIPAPALHCSHRGEPLGAESTRGLHAPAKTVLDKIAANRRAQPKGRIAPTFLGANPEKAVAAGTRFPIVQARMAAPATIKIAGTFPEDQSPNPRTNTVTSPAIIDASAPIALAFFE